MLYTYDMKGAPPYCVVWLSSSRTGLRRSRTDRSESGFWTFVPASPVWFGCSVALPKSRTELGLSSFMGDSCCLDASKLAKLSSCCSMLADVVPLLVKDTVVAVEVEAVVCSDVFLHRRLRQSAIPPTSSDEEESSSSRPVVLLLGTSGISDETNLLRSWLRGLSRISRTLLAWMWLRRSR
jgi:hypothetical protein